MGRVRGMIRYPWRESVKLLSINNENWLLRDFVPTSIMNQTQLEEPKEREQKETVGAN